MAIPLVVLGFAGVLVTAVAAIVVFAIGHLVLDVSRTTIFQRVVPDAYRGRFTGLLMTVQGIGEVAGTLVMPALVSVAGFGPVLGALGMILFLVTIARRPAHRSRGRPRHRVVRHPAATDCPAADLRGAVGRSGRGRAARPGTDPRCGRRGRRPPGRRRGSLLRGRRRQVRGDAERTGRWRSAGDSNAGPGRHLRRARPDRSSAAVRDRCCARARAAVRDGWRRLSRGGGRAPRRVGTAHGVVRGARGSSDARLRPAGPPGQASRISRGRARGGGTPIGRPEPWRCASRDRRCTTRSPARAGAARASSTAHIGAMK